MKIVNISKNLQNVGLFGVLDGAVVKKLAIEDARVYGYNHVWYSGRPDKRRVRDHGRDS